MTPSLSPHSLPLLPVSLPCAGEPRSVGDPLCQPADGVEQLVTALVLVPARGVAGVHQLAHPRENVLAARLTDRAE